MASQRSIKRIIRRGSVNTRVELDDGTEKLVPNSELVLSNSTDTTSLSTPSKPVGERFKYLESLVDMVVSGQSPSLIICGDAGIGKTHLVRQRLQKSGLKEEVVSSEDDKLPAPTKSSKIKAAFQAHKQSKDIYLFVKGYSSAMGLYRILHDNRWATIVFDDCDSVFKDSTSVNLLKSALDSYDVRIISWVSQAAIKAGLDTRFEFKGKIVFISNLKLGKLDSAVRSRSFTCEIALTRPELWQRMLDVLPYIEPAVGMDVKTDVLNHLAFHLDSFTEFNMRTFIKAVRLRQANPSMWKDMVVSFA